MVVVSGTASTGNGNTVAVTVAVGEVLEPVSNNRKRWCWFYLTLTSGGL